MAVVSTVDVVKTLAFPAAAVVLDQLAGRARDAADAAEVLAAILRDTARAAAHGPAANRQIELEQPVRVDGLSVDALLAAAAGWDRCLL